MSDRFFYYWQKTGGEDPWQVGLAESRQHIQDTERPRFVTVLDVDAAVDETFTKQQIQGLKYRGPIYVDMDGEDVGVVLDQARTLLGKFVALDVDPRSIRIYATGGRGFHFELGWEAFLPKIPKHGIAYLPAIYKEMIYEIYLDTVDLRVYSARKGRMWRTPNVQRENGRYKVPITPEELMEMSVEDYQVLCSAPRKAVPLTPPTLSQKLAVMYAKAESKIDAAAKKKKDAKKDFELLAKFKGAYPPSLAAVMNGTIVNETTGFHTIALQVAITSNALGKSEEQMIAAAEGVIANHKSDGTRYNTPQKRKNELLRLYSYTQDNPCYEYSRDAVRRLVPIGTASADLDGLTPEASGEITASSEDGNAEGLHGGVFVTEKGIFCRKEEGATKISEVSFRDVSLLCSAETGEPFGYEAELLLLGKSRGRKLIDTTNFLSKQKYHLFCMQNMGIFTGTDNQVAALSAILRDTAMKNDKVVYIIHREGLDLIQRPDEKDKALDFVWVTPKSVETQSPKMYKHRGSPNPDGYFKSDLLDAPDFVASDETAAVVQALLNFNEPYAVANLLGWFVSAFHRQVYHHMPDSKFPLLQLFGQSGSGKSSTAQQLMRLFYYNSSPVILPADSSTLHGIRSAIQSSASIPVILEEFKPRQFGPGKYMGLLQMLRSAYNAQTLAKGGMADGINATWKDVRLFAFSAPIGFIGESLETETAILERTVSVPLSKGSLTGREAYHNLLTDRRDIVSSLGKQIVKATFAMDLEAFRSAVEANQNAANKIAFKRNNHRVVFNLSVAMTGLEFLGGIVRHYFGTTFEARFTELRTAMLDVSKHVAVSVMPEAGKVLNILAHITRTEDSTSEFGLKEGMDYVLGGDYLDLQMKNCYFKYVGWLKRKGQTPLYDNEDAFLHGLGNYSPMVSKANLGSPLKHTGMEKIYRFNLKALQEEGVEPFRTAA
jgi:hypothetical protein